MRKYFIITQKINNETFIQRLTAAYNRGID